MQHEYRGEKNISIIVRLLESLLAAELASHFSSLQKIPYLFLLPNKRHSTEICIMVFLLSCRSHTHTRVGRCLCCMSHSQRKDERGGGKFTLEGKSNELDTFLRNPGGPEKCSSVQLKTEPRTQKDLQQSCSYKSRSFTSNFPSKSFGPNYVKALEQLSAGTLVYASNDKLPVLVCDHARSQKYRVQKV